VEGTAKPFTEKEGQPTRFKRHPGKARPERERDRFEKKGHKERRGNYLQGQRKGRGKSCKTIPRELDKKNNHLFKGKVVWKGGGAPVGSLITAGNSGGQKRVRGRWGRGGRVGGSRCPVKRKTGGQFVKAWRKRERG